MNSTEVTHKDAQKSGMTIWDALYLIAITAIGRNWETIVKYFWLAYEKLTGIYNEHAQVRAEIAQRAYAVRYEDLYRTMPVQAWETRILHVQPAKRLTDPVKCKVKVVSLKEDRDPGEYMALSYTWGAEKPIWPILCNGFEIKVTKSCRDAIQALRSHQCLRIWIDQVCINQLSLPERSDQVTMMGLIYGRATTVYVYFNAIDQTVINGKKVCSPEAVSLGLQRIEKRWITDKTGLQSMSDAQKYSAGFQDSMIHHPRNRAAKALEAMETGNRKVLQDWIDEMVIAREVLKQRYFERKWIIQELAINNNIKILIGSCCVSIEILAPLATDMIQTLMLLQEVRTPNAMKLLDILHPDTTTTDFPRKFSNVTEIIEFRRVFSEEGKQDPIEVISKFSDFVTTVPVDSVYALRTLLPSTMPVPNYALEPLMVYLQHTNWLVQNNWGARMLSSARLLLENSDVYPSWTIDFRSSTERTKVILEHGMKFSDHLPPFHCDEDERWLRQEKRGVAFIDQDGRDVSLKDIRPCGTERIPSSVRMVGQPQLFCADGFVLDKIEAIESSTVLRPGWPELMKHAKVMEFFRQRNQTQEVRQFIARAAWWERIKQKENEIKCTVYNSSQFQMEVILYNLVVSGNLEVMKKSFNGIYADAEVAILPTSMRQKVDSTSDMKFAYTKEGWIGLVPKTSRVGDEIAFFHGVKAPFVLCPWAEGRCRLRGRAHILSLMWWWDWTYNLNAAKQVKTFAIV